MRTEEIHTYCPMCVAQCGVIAVVEDGKFTGVRPDSDHPNGGICIKGYSAPEIVYSSDRLLHPFKRTRPKGDPDPGWVEISWQKALGTVATRLFQIKEEYGPEAVVFGRATPAGSASSDFETWLIRLANAFGSPNVLATTHICTWNVRCDGFGTGIGVLVAIVLAAIDGRVNSLYPPSLGCQPSLPGGRLFAGSSPLGGGSDRRSRGQTP